MSDINGNTAVVTTPQQQRDLERFYHYEARLLDSREYQQWLELVSKDICYSMPSRINVQINNRDRGQESMLALENELERPEGMGSPLREETYIHLMLRVERAFKMNSWSENPPARTRRMVGNIELMAQREGRLSVISNFHMYYARPGAESVVYSGQRRDVLIESGAGEGSYLIHSREVIMDYANIEVPTLGLLF
ncbi:MAG: aromatic-ring-hydroxylating dioxygenase subunit beta [Proteobacteria bacterium]|nr:aromatic-ring-hydroxylating dioxygenase subunit beta [Pseudomonadota bacterium]